MQPGNVTATIRTTGAEQRREALLTRLTAEVPRMRQRAVTLDHDGGFPTDDIALLRAAGALAAPLPCALGGTGMGTEPEGSTALMQALRLIGEGGLSVGRLFEGHVNALRLITRYGGPAQVARAAADACAGHLFGLWVTDAPDAPLRAGGNGVLTGAKEPCSGAGHAGRALITARMPDGATRMLLLTPSSAVHTDLTGWDPSGMRGTGSGRVSFDGERYEPDDLIGAPGDYLRQPEFSAGAWRTSAVTLGGLSTLCELLCGELAARGRDADPHQQARIGTTVIALETSALWVWRAACVAECEHGRSANDIANYVNLARIAVERACLDAIQLAQRSLGMSAFRRGTLIELVMRDLAMYLRQPAPDITLTEAAAHFARHPLPPLPPVC